MFDYTAAFQRVRNFDSSSEAMNIPPERVRNFGSNRLRLKPVVANSWRSSDAPIDTKVAVPRIIPKNVALINGVNFVRSTPAA